MAPDQPDDPDQRLRVELPRLPLRRRRRGRRADAEPAPRPAGTAETPPAPKEGVDGAEADDETNVIPVDPSPTSVLDPVLYAEPEHEAVEPGGPEHGESDWNGGGYVEAPAAPATTTPPVARTPVARTPVTRTPVTHTPIVPTPDPDPTADTSAGTTADTSAGETAPPARRRTASSARRRLTAGMSHLTGWRAAAIGGLVAGVAMVVLVELGLLGCTAVYGTDSCGMVPGGTLLVVVFVLSILAGAIALKALRVTDPVSTSFIGVGLTSVVALIFLVPVLDTWPMFLVIPAITVVTMPAAWWLTNGATTDASPSSHSGPSVPTKRAKPAEDRTPVQ